MTSSGDASEEPTPDDPAARAGTEPTVDPADPPESDPQQSLLDRLRSSKVAFVVWVLLATLVAVPLLYASSTRLGPGTVEVRMSPTFSGATELALPPLGSIAAPTHRAPVRVAVELREVDVLRALQGTDGTSAEGAADGDVGQLIEAEVRDDLGDAVRHAATALLLVAAGCGAVAALCFPGRRSVTRVAAGAGLGVVAIVVLVAPMGIGYDEDAFIEHPTLTGQLASAEELLAGVGSLETRFGSVESRARVLTDRIAGLYSTALTDRIAGSDGDVSLLHVSDLHLNSVGLALARDLAVNFDVDAVVDTGDVTSFGFDPEAAFIDLLADFEVPYVIVAGNHDSQPVRDYFAASDDVIYLDDDTIEIAGLTIAGMVDPTETALRRIPREQLRRSYERQFDATERLVEETSPDLLLIHNPVQATPVLGKVPVIAAGHLHRSEIEIVDGTVLAVVGSSGATGLGNLLVDEQSPYEFEVLRFVDNVLVAIDNIVLDGADGDFRLTRRLITADEIGASDEESELTEVEVDSPTLEDLSEEEIDRVTSTTDLDAVFEDGRLTTTTLPTTDPPTTTTPPTGD